MKKILIAFLMALAWEVQAQQLSPYNSYVNFPVIVNAAFAGLDSTAANAIFLYRNQWTGIDGSPESVMFVLEGSLKNHPVGVGLQAYRESSNIRTVTAGYALSSYRVSLTSKHKLSFGLSAGVLNNGIDFGKVRAQNIDDPLLLQQDENRTTFDLNAGVVYQYTKLLTVAFSTQQILGQSISYEDQGDQRASSFRLFRHYQLMSFIKLPLKGNYGVRMIGVLKSAQSLKPQFDYGLQGEYLDVVRVALLYRHANSFAALLGFTISEKLRFTYSYELPANGLGVSNTQGTHEFGLNYRILK